MGRLAAGLLTVLMASTVAATELRWTIEVEKPTGIERREAEVARPAVWFLSMATETRTRLVI